MILDNFDFTGKFSYLKSPLNVLLDISGSLIGKYVVISPVGDLNILTLIPLLGVINGL